MNMPGFAADTATYNRGAFFYTHEPVQGRPPVGTITMAQCGPGYTGPCTTTCDCTPIVPPTRCGEGEILCPCTSTCMSPLGCKITCWERNNNH
jgi:hypothetical protein